ISFQALFVLLVAFNTSFSQYNERPGLVDSLMTKIEEQIGQTKVKSVVVGVWKGQNEVLTLALGESMSMVPSTKDMHIRIGGVTETFQGTLLMMLVEQGHLKLDDKISKWLPDLLSADEVTVEMLIKNTAG